MADEGATCFQDFYKRVQHCAQLKDPIEATACTADAELSLAGCIAHTVTGISKLTATKIARAAVAGIPKTLFTKFEKGPK